MKKLLFAIVALFLGTVQMNAQTIYFEDAQIPENGQGIITLKFETGGRTIIGYGFELVLPKGLSVALKGSNPNWSPEDGNDVVNLTFQAPASFGFLPSGTDTQVKGTEGRLMSVYLVADNTLSEGQELTVKVQKAMMIEKLSESDDQQTIKIDDFSFKVTISDKWVLDENTAALSPASNGEVKVLVKRTISANQWSTICLPFDMWGDQVEEVFGADSQFATFTSYTKDGGTPSTKQAFTAESIKLNFDTHDWVANDGIFANTPYLVKLSKDIDEFIVEDVDINPSENVDVQVKTAVTTGRVCGHFYGTECAGKIIPEYGLFLNGNNFHYSKGKTKIKGFRGYFVLNDILADLASPGVKIYVDGDATSIDGIGFQQNIDGVYDLSGRKIKIEGNDLNKLQKGVYIIDGKKVTIK